MPQREGEVQRHQPLPAAWHKFDGASHVVGLKLSLNIGLTRLTVKERRKKDGNVPSLALLLLPHPVAQQSPASQGTLHGVPPHPLPVLWSPLVTKEDHLVSAKEVSKLLLSTVSLCRLSELNSNWSSGQLTAPGLSLELANFLYGYRFRQLAKNSSHWKELEKVDTPHKVEKKLSQ